MSAALILAVPAWAAALAVMALLWVWQLRTRNAAVVDVGWTALVAALAGYYAVRYTDGMLARRCAVGAMYGSWGARLTVMLLHDRVLGRAEEGRYANLRARRAPHADRWFFWFFQGQALAAILFSLPALFSVLNPQAELSRLELAAAGLWIIGFTGESTADRQLLYFKLNVENRGKTCRSGLWRYSRHPNYFFEWLMWVAYGLFACAAPYGWIALVCPALMLFLLVRVTGIPPNEAQAIRTRGDDYRHYQQTTSAFIPWRPRRTLHDWHAAC